jgi:hypothetical protein
MPTAKVVQERVFFPYQPYLDSASHFCGELKRKDYPSWYDLLAAVTLLSLSVEALLNTIGEFVVADFKDFEFSPPKAKLRIICQSAGVEFRRDKSPFGEVLQLMRVRNQLAHPKYQRLRYESRQMPLEEARKHYEELGELLHDIEKSLTPDFAQRSLEAVEGLAQLLRSKLKPAAFQSSSKRLVIDGVDPCQEWSDQREV